MGHTVRGEYGDDEVDDHGVPAPRAELPVHRQERDEHAGARRPAEGEDERESGGDRQRQGARVAADSRQAGSGESECGEPRVTGELPRIPVPLVQRMERRDRIGVPEEVREQEQNQVRGREEVRARSRDARVCPDRLRRESGGRQDLYGRQSHCDRDDGGDEPDPGRNVPVSLPRPPEAPHPHTGAQHGEREEEEHLAVAAEQRQRERAHGEQETPNRLALGEQVDAQKRPWHPDGACQHPLLTEVAEAEAARDERQPAHHRSPPVVRQPAREERRSPRAHREVEDDEEIVRVDVRQEQEQRGERIEGAGLVREQRRARELEGVPGWQVAGAPRLGDQVMDRQVVQEAVPRGDQNEPRKRGGEDDQWEERRQEQNARARDTAPVARPHRGPRAGVSVDGQAVYVPAVRGADTARAERVGRSRGEIARATVAAAIAYAATIRAGEPPLSWWPTSQKASETTGAARGGAGRGRGPPPAGRGSMTRGAIPAPVKTATATRAAPLG